MLDKETTYPTFVSDFFVAELGSRVAVGACGTILAQLGATVVVVEGIHKNPDVETKQSYRSNFLAGKKSFQFIEDSSEDLLDLANLIKAADVLVYSSDIDPDFYNLCKTIEVVNQVKCDITAFGSTGPLSNRAYSEQFIQALSGILDTTGLSTEPPIPIKYPLVELSTGVYAASAILAAKRLYKNTHMPQIVEVALYDVAFLSTASFLPSYFIGKNPQRIGNRHPSMSPWNLYPTTDGWILLCSGSNEEWERICSEFNSPNLVFDKLFLTPSDRVKNCKLIDGIIEGWTSSLATDEALRKFTTAGVACGPVYSLEELFKDQSLAAYNFFQSTKDPISRNSIRIPGQLFYGSISRSAPFKNIPKVNQDRDFIKKLLPKNDLSPKKFNVVLNKPLAGIRVLEMGNYTTAPLIGRQLGALGAYVVKIEPPRGDLCRSLPPHKDGQGYFFTLGNSDKSSIIADLTSESGKSTFIELIKKTDILVENLKSGSLKKLGFDNNKLLELNPKLIHCSITGFGSKSKLATVAAMDTTIQGMAGMMCLTTNQKGVPYKSGVSAADLTGGQLGLVAVLGALEFRDQSNVGQHIDLSMQMAGSWLTQTAWNGNVFPNKDMVVSCKDGFLLCQVNGDMSLGYLLNNSHNYIIQDLKRMLLDVGVQSIEISTISQAAECGQTKARNLIKNCINSHGIDWPILACPMRFSSIKVDVAKALGEIGSDGNQILKDWGITI
jgi:crotonobetainyl-CoA:carnitine CoA-transferase CaiB-like acyl-CoA transferase